MKIDEELKEVLLIVAWTLLFCFIAGFGLFHIGDSLKKKSCTLKTRDFEKSEYNYLTGCMVRHNNKWIPLTNVRSFENE